MNISNPKNNREMRKMIRDFNECLFSFSHYYNQSFARMQNTLSIEDAVHKFAEMYSNPKVPDSMKNIASHMIELLPNKHDFY